MLIKVIDESKKFDEELIKKCIEELNMTRAEAIDLLTSLMEVKKGKVSKMTLKTRRFDNV